MKRIKLTQGKFTLVDDDTYALLPKNRWCFDKETGYAVARIKEKKISLHRFIMGAVKGQYCDHVNMDKLDNRKANLRLCTASENGRNRSKQSNNTSGYKGVSWNERRGEYDVRLKVDGKSIWIGWFKNLNEAVNAYDASAIKNHGEFARTNLL